MGHKPGRSPGGQLLAGGGLGDYRRLRRGGKFYFRQGALGLLGGLLGSGVAQEVTQRGDSTWFEGLQLLAVYAVLALTFFFV